MEIITFTKPGAIYLQWDDLSPSTVERTEDGMDWETIATDIQTGYYEDRSTEEGVPYQYRVTTNDISVISDWCWSLPNRLRYGYVAQTFKEMDESIYCLARIYDEDTGEILDPDTVSKAEYLVEELYEGRPACVFGPDVLGRSDYNELDPQKVLTSNLVLASPWCLDHTGFNFFCKVHVPEYDQLRVVVRLTLEDGTTLFLYFTWSGQRFLKG